MKKYYNKLKILIISPSDLAENNGITVRAKRVFELLHDEYDVSLVGSKNNVFDSKTTLIKEAFFWMLKLISIVSTKKINCIYCSSDYFGFVACYPIAKLCRYKIIYEAHGILSEETKERGNSKLIIYFCKALERFVIQRADYVIALSKDIFEYYSVFNNNIDLIPVFVDESIYCNKVKKDFNINSIKKIGVIGPFNMPSNKFSLDFIHKHLHEFNSKINFIVIGNCNEHCTADTIKYTGYLSFSDYVNQLLQLDAVLVPSKVATSGPLNKILEPMACSLPVFTTPKGTVGIDYAKNGENIFIFENNELVAKINELIFNDELMQKIGKDARHTVEKYYGKKSNKNKIIQIIDNINLK